MIMLEDVTTLYDDRAALRRAIAVLPETTSTEALTSLDHALIRNEEQLRIAVRILPEEEREDIMYFLDNDYGICRYGGGAWEYLESLLK